MFKRFFTRAAVATLGVLSLFSLASCTSEDSSESTATQGGNKLPTTSESVGFAIHYNVKTKTNDKYTYNLWLWENGGNGGDYQFNEEDSYGCVFRTTWEEFSTTAYENGIGFIVKTNKTWDEGPTKDIDADRFIDFKNYAKDEYGYHNIYLKNGDENIYSSAKGETIDKVSFFRVVNNNLTGFSLLFATNKPFSKFEIKCGDEVVCNETTVSLDSNKDYTRYEHKIGTTTPNLKNPYVLSVTFKDSGKTLTEVCNMAAVYISKAFNEEYTYTGELGAIYSATSTTFRVWSPVSTDMKLRVYENGTPKSLGGDDTYTEYQMTEGEKGTWEYTAGGDLSGKYYTYVVTNATYKNMEVVDPYAKSCGLNGLRGMVVDFSKTNPEGWDSVELNEINSTNLTVYETHIADLTSSDTWGGNKENSKKFKGFYETGTTYTKGDVTVSTGFDHIKELGVNAVQIIPFFDQANEERDGKTSFNWGYNPLNYNTLEGSYSSNPSDGYVRIREFKELVKAYNEAGINIIMDVVYNHVNGLDRSNFDVLMPKYYFRYAGGTPSNGSGCGNETASEMSMFRKFMIDSTEFWASEYKLGGFRFDLMGIHDVDTMNQLVKNLHENVSEYITVYGEPWAGGTIALTGSAANQSSISQFEGFGAFNDKMRDALIKGGLCGQKEKGWITNDTSVSKADLNDIKNGLTGIAVSYDKNPYKTVNYVTCHDNYTLYDRIKAAGITDSATIKSMAMLANSVVFTSEGVTFMLAGEEFLRTKGGNSNSYNSSYKVNELNYELKVDNLDMFENYKKLISLKQQQGLFDKDIEGIKNIEIKTNSDGSLIYFDITDTITNRTYRIAHSNGVAGDKTVNFEGFTLYLDTLNKTGLELTSTTQLDSYQTIIAYIEG